MVDLVQMVEILGYMLTFGCKVSILDWEESLTSNPKKFRCILSGRCWSKVSLPIVCTYFIVMARVFLGVESSTLPQEGINPNLVTHIDLYELTKINVFSGTKMTKNLLYILNTKIALRNAHLLRKYSSLNILRFFKSKDEC